MAGEEGDVVPPPAVDAVVEVLRDVDDVEREPAEDEDHQDGHQEAAPPPVPSSLSPPSRQALTAVKPGVKVATLLSEIKMFFIVQISNQTPF